MKKIVKLLSLVLVLVTLITLTGCSSKREAYKTIDIPTDIVLIDIVVQSQVAEGETFVGLISETVDKKATLYLNGATVPAGKYEVVTIKTASKVANDGTYSYPELPVEGLTFAGWYKTADFENGTRATTNKTIGDTNVLYARYITLADACLITVVCILIVFSMLALLWGIVSLFKFIAPKEEVKTEVKKAVSNQQISASKKVFTMNDITDEDMMAAALVATIDYHNETGENVRVVSVKHIG